MPDAALTRHGTIAPNVVETVGISTYCGAINIVNRGASDIFFRMDGIDPTIAGDDCRVVPANSQREFGPPQPDKIVVKMIAAGSTEYSVEIL